MASACTTAKRPPKLRAACNECHAAKASDTRSSGLFLQSNFRRLVCIFSISRIGKVPGKRSKANRAAAAAAALAASSSSSTLNSTSSTSLPSPTNLIPPNEALHSFRSLQHSEDGTNVSRPPYPVTVLTGFPRDPSSMITPVHDYTSNIQFYAGDGPHPDPVSLPDVLPSNAPYILPTNVDIGLSDLSNLPWTAELDQLSAYGLPTPGLEIPCIAKAPPLPFSDRQINHAQAQNFPQTQSQEWDLDSGSNTSSVDPRRTSITSIRAPITPPDYNVLDDAVPPTPHSMRPLDPLSSSAYLQLLHDIEQTTALGHTHTVDSVLAANQRYLSTLLRMTETPGFQYGYDTHLLFTVALRKIIALFTAGYRDFVIRMEGPESNINGINSYANSHNNSNNVATGINGSGADRLIRFGVFEIDLVEQKAICRSILLRELKRARLCLIRLVDVLERDSGGCGGAGRHEGMCEEMSRRLDLLVGSLEGE
ncbi:uncharacterized protein KD926_011370 [Aspergillus affinis]|uniref:uncharacterized protein n=1 Tax=Aspergillus affinis TaxID=1070780 RepID=UPI0022FF0D86|nr:uncharacterized protein KD926_011370 [Aspergillus affinis]KAI9038032.1 hypothetical protein KD926_011370 [Aspergillus affinis]